MSVAERRFEVFPRSSLIVSAIAPGAVAAIALLAVIAALVAGQSNFLARYWPMLAILFVGGLAGLRPSLVLSHEIVLRETEARFRGLRKELVVRRGEATSLKPAMLQPGAFEIRTSQERATFSSRFTAFDEVVAALKAQNPGMAVRGC